MLFNSYPFLCIYLPIVLGIFLTLARFCSVQVIKGWLLISSLCFYGYWNVYYVPLLLFSMIVNYCCGQTLLNYPAIKKPLLWGAISINLGLLFYYKYWNFFLTTIGQHVIIEEIILPLGISFFTFTQIAYLVDAYQSKADTCDPLSYGLFVTIFPHLIAGPVLHHKSMLKQFDQLKTNAMNWSLIAQGIFLFCLGMGKKVMIADYLTQFVTPIFDGTLQEVPFIQAWFGALAYTLQLYFDFSGYSDMAVGLGLIFGLELPTNFNSPYQASSMIDFWHRWHITLSQFLRDYLYIPLGGSRYGYLMKMRNLFITMLLGGMWHGAGWTFIVWGICHGFFLIVNHLWRDAKLSIPYSLARLVTLLAVIITWVIFRSPTMDQAFYILKGMVGLNGIILPEGYAQYFAFLTPWGVKFMHLSASKFHVMDLIFLIALSYIALICANSSVWLHRFQDNPKRWVLPCSGLFFLSFIYLDQLAEFLYYQF